MSDRENRTGIFELGQNPELPDLFRVSLRELALLLRTHSVARVISYNPATQTANLSVDILQVIKDNFTPATNLNPNPVKIQTPVLLNDIKVLFPRTATGYVTFPVAPGDTGELHVQDRSIDQWRATGLPTDPVSAFAHMLGDSTFHPGLFPDTNPIVPPTSLTATVLEGPLINLGPLAALGVARETDPVAPDAAMFAWALVVETAINALAPGTFTPANSFLGTVGASFGLISGASIKVSSE